MQLKFAKQWSYGSSWRGGSAFVIVFYDFRSSRQQGIAGKLTPFGLLDSFLQSVTAIN